MLALFQINTSWDAKACMNEQKDENALLTSCKQAHAQSQWSVFFGPCRKADDAGSLCVTFGLVSSKKFSSRMHAGKHTAKLILQLIANNLQ